MIKHGTAGGRCQTDQLVLVIHNFSIKLDCRHILFLFLYLKKEKKKKKKGWHVPRCLAILFSNTVSWGGFFSHPRIISTHYNIPSHGSVWTPQCKTCSVTLFLSSSSECFLLFRAGERVRNYVCAYACVYVLVEKCTNRIRYKIKWYSMPLFSVGKKYIYTLASI